MEVLSHSLEEFSAVASDFALSLKKSAEGARLVTLSGELGSGKTTFVQSVARALGISEAVTSPTFVIEKIYNLKDQEFNKLIHIDAYRLENSLQLINLGWRDILSENGNVIFLEWPEKVADILPSERANVFFQSLGEDERGINIEEIKSNQT